VSLIGHATPRGGPSYRRWLDLAWRLETTGDFDGDGDVDYAWRRYPSGEVLIWFLNEDGKYISYGSLPTVKDTCWSIVGASDINRDGFEDLVWYHSPLGESLVWYLSGSGADLLGQPKPDQFRPVGSSGAFRIDRSRVACSA
jgi:hypothetical protein